MTEYLLGQRQIKRHQENGPVDGMEADNILSNQVQIRRPVPVKLLCGLSVTVVADSGNIVGQRIQPYIGYMLGIKAYRNPPAKGGALLCAPRDAL